MLKPLTAPAINWITSLTGESLRYHLNSELLDDQEIEETENWMNDLLQKKIPNRRCINMAKHAPAN
jgi:hypothetical protein